MTVAAPLAAAVDHFRAERLAEAEAGAKAALAADARAHAAWHLLAAIEHRKGDLAACEAALRQAIEIAPANALYRVDLGSLLATQKRAAEAEVEFRAAIAADKGYLPGYFRLAELLADLDRDWDAETALREAVAARPKLAETHFRLGVFLQERVRPGQAARAFALAFNLDRSNADAANRLATALGVLGRSVEALPALQAVLRTAPDNQAALYNLATILIQEGRFDEAEPLVARATAAYPDLPMARQLRDALDAKRGAAPAEPDAGRAG